MVDYKDNNGKSDVFAETGGGNLAVTHVVARKGKADNNAYAKAGVDTLAASRAVARIKGYTELTRTAGVMRGIGDFGGFFDLQKSAQWIDPILVSAADGVGTKLRLAADCDLHYGIGIDLVAMCVNDIVTHGAKPLFFMDYLASAKLDEKLLEEVIAGISAGCIKAETALIGGETAVMPGHYAKKDYDLAGFVVGAVERDKIIPKNYQNDNIESPIKADDAVIAIESSGFHANGYSLIRKIIADNKINLAASTQWSENKNIAEMLLEPTKIYVRAIMAIADNPSLKAIAHITGGGVYENIPRILPDNLKAVINAAQMPELPLFRYLKKIGNLSADDMWHTFNCGIGMIVIAQPEEVDFIIKKIAQQGEKAYLVGDIKNRQNNGNQVEIINDRFDDDN